MTQDRKGSAHERDDLNVQGFGLGLEDMGDDPSEMFATPQTSRAGAHAHATPAASTAARPHVHHPEPDLPEIDDPFGGPGGFDPAPSRQAAPPRHAQDPGDWGSMTSIGGPPTRGAPGGFGDAGHEEGDPAAEFSGFETAQGVASLGQRSEGSLGFRREPEPDPDHPPKGSYRGDDPGFDAVVGNFGEADDEPEPPKGSLYRETVDDEQDEVDEGDQSLALRDEDDENRGDDEQDDESEASPSLVDRLKRFAIPVAAAAAIGGAGYVGWGFVSPMLGLGGDAAPVQMAGPIVPKQPNAQLPSFPPAAGAQQRPALPGTAGTLPALPGQQASTVAPGYQPQQGLPPQGLTQTQPLPQVQPRQVGLQPVQGSLLPQPGFPPGQGLPSAAPVQQAQSGQPYGGTPAVQLPGVGGPSSNLLPAAQPGLGAEPVREAPRLGGGLNARTGASSDVETRLASIAADLAAMRSRQDDAARTARSDMDDLRGRLGEMERKVGDGRRVQPAKPAPVSTEEAEAKPRHAERVERPARSIRRAEPRAAYQQEASADDGLPPLKPKVVQGFNLRGVSRGVASVEGRGGVVEVGVGQNIPGVGEVKAIRRYGNDWVVVVGKGVIVQQ